MTTKAGKQIAISLQEYAQKQKNIKQQYFRSLNKYKYSAVFKVLSINFGGGLSYDTNDGSRYFCLRKRGRRSAGMPQSNCDCGCWQSAVPLGFYILHFHLRLLNYVSLF